MDYEIYNNSNTFCNVWFRAIDTNTEYSVELLPRKKAVLSEGRLVVMDAGD